jgi:hypothetical protein
LAKPGKDLKESPCGQKGQWTEGMVCSCCNELEMGKCRGGIHEACYTSLNPGSAARRALVLLRH